MVRWGVIGVFIVIFVISSITNSYGLEGKDVIRRNVAVDLSDDVEDGNVAVSIKSICKPCFLQLRNESNMTGNVTFPFEEDYGDYSGARERIYVYGVGGMIGAKINDGEFIYYHKDGIVNNVIKSDSDGNLIGRHILYAYGGDFDQYGSKEALTDNFKFVGREQDDFSFYNLGKRYYKPGLGRFISVDPKEKDSYGYGKGNPLRYIDPDGEESVDVRNIDRVQNPNNYFGFDSVDRNTYTLRSVDSVMPNSRAYGVASGLFEILRIVRDMVSLQQIKDPLALDPTVLSGYNKMLNDLGMMPPSLFNKGSVVVYKPNRDDLINGLFNINDEKLFNQYMASFGHRFSRDDKGRILLDGKPLDKKAANRLAELHNQFESPKLILKDERGKNSAAPSDATGVTLDVDGRYTVIEGVIVLTW
jgi:RHS repeat-associated protein